VYHFVIRRSTLLRVLLGMKGAPVLVRAPVDR
jgi:hypothetical protein